MLLVAVPSNGEIAALNTTDRPAACAAWKLASKLASLSDLAGSAITVSLVPVWVQIRSVSSIEFEPSEAMV